MKQFLLLATMVLVLAACKETKNIETNKILSDEALMDTVQRSTFRYFWDFAEPTSGLARERYHPDDIYPENDKHIVTMGGSGFGLMAILVGIERGYITKEEGTNRFLKAFNFLDKAERHHGVWPHWLNGETGQTRDFGDKDNGGDLVETAFLVEGIICVREYYKNSTDENEKQVAELADKLWKSVEWDWHTNNQDFLFWHWSPSHQWEMNFPLEGYNECLIPYILGAASPTHTIPADAYHKGWTRNGTFVTDQESYGFKHILKYNTEEAHTGPLFWAHYSYTGLSPKGLKDKYADYWQLNTNQAKIHHAYALENPKEFKNYGDSCWGLTASYTRNADNTIGYSAHHPGGHDKGIISPTAALSSMPYTPEESTKAMHYFYEKVPGLMGEAGFYDAFSPEDNWMAKRYLAIDQGPIIVMIENYRTGLLWNLFMQAPEVQEGLNKLGFTYNK